MKIRIWAALIPVLLVAMLLFGSPEKSVSATESQTRLVLLLTVDQLRFDYLRRLENHFQGGFKRLLTQGVEFLDAHQDHAVTTTGPGHAALSTGRFPSHSGIIDNSWYDRDLKKVVNCVEDREAETLSSSWPGRSPRLLLVDGLGDWLKQSHQKAKVYSASGKDRGAILLGGLEADGAFWYDSETGHLVTSDYYMSEYPPWVESFNQRDLAGKYFGTAWTPLPVSENVLRDGAFTTIDLGAFEEGFPRALGPASLTPGSAFYSGFRSSPFSDELLKEFAKALIEGAQLGEDEAPDLLGLSFSALDLVGHRYGPNSKEVLDVLLRLDLTLGDLFDFLDQKVGVNQWVVALSSDHGVVPLPEYRREASSGQRIGTTDVLCYQRAGRRLSEELGPEEWLEHGLYLNYAALGRSNLRRQEVEEKLATLLAACDPVSRLWTRTQLLDPPRPDDSRELQLYRRSFHPERSGDLMLQVARGWLAMEGRGTTHGSPYDYDTHVPLIMLGRGLPARRVEGRVRTVDLAPTLARMLGISMPEDVDGRDLTSRFLVAP